MDFVDQLKASADIVKVVGERVILKKRGGNSYTGLCPFHSEKSPSFHVHAGQQFYKCFGCGAGGDVIKFVMEFDKVGFQEATTTLAERFGVSIPRRTSPDDPEARMRTAVQAMHEIAARYYQQNLQQPAGEEARAYLAKRRLSADSIAEFQLGYSDRSSGAMIALLKRQGYSPVEIEASGLAGKREDGSLYDRFRGRLMFPILSETAKVIAFGARALAAGEEPKYLNSSNNPVYHKSSVLYHIDKARDGARKNGRFVLVEGYMDVIRAWEAGVGEAVAPCGTALTQQQARAMRRHSDTVLMNFDSDNAGLAAADKSIETLRGEGLKVSVVMLRGGKDPDEFIQTLGAEEYRKRLDASLPYFTWKVEQAKRKFDITKTQGKLDALESLTPLLRQMHNPIERAELASEMAAAFAVEKRLVLDQVRRTVATAGERRLELPAVDLPHAEKLLLQLAMRNAEVRGVVIEAVSASERLRGGPSWPIWQALLAAANPGPFRYAAFEEKLEEPERILMASLLLADQMEEETNLMAQAAACLVQLSADDRRAAIHNVKSRIREAEQRGAIAEAFSLIGELHDLERE